MKMKILIFVCALISAPVSLSAQSIYEPVENLSIDSYYQEWLADYEETGRKINDISETYQKEVDKRGYPKKKTVKAKIELVDHYVQLLQTQLTDTRLNQNLDTQKVQDKITLWQGQLTDLQALLKKI
ncbi:MAG: hypothetical protein IJV27_03980 [Prevotella sp.]|nr:hypothetical protein [Prevotella sp.]